LQNVSKCFRSKENVTEDFYFSEISDSCQYFHDMLKQSDRIVFNIENHCVIAY